MAVASAYFFAWNAASPSANDTGPENFDVVSAATSSSPRPIGFERSELCADACVEIGAPVFSCDVAPFFEQPTAAMVATSSTVVARVVGFMGPLLLLAAAFC